MAPHSFRPRPNFPVFFVHFATKKEYNIVDVEQKPMSVLLRVTEMVS